MSTLNLPDFDHGLAMASGNLDGAGLAECHGIACGLLVRQYKANPDAFFDLLGMLEVIHDPAPGFRDLLAELFAATRDQLGDDEMGLTLWLPDEDESLEERTAALAQWCNGFLAAIGSGDDKRLDSLSGEAAESLADLQEIAMAELGKSEDTEGGDLEEEEGAFAEIIEYIRIAVLILREELRGPRDGDSIH